MRLAEVDSPLPPILVDRCSMRVIDGMHRLLAATLKGNETIDVEFFDGGTADAFLRAVEANVKHGLPLSKADRQAAAARIIGSHPQLSDRAIAQCAGLGAKAVASIRRRSTDTMPQLSARLGRDGRVRPLSAEEGRQRAADLLAERPRASLREVARGAGISWATARDVRSRLEFGQEPGPDRPLLGDAGATPAVAGVAFASPAAAGRPPDRKPGAPTPARLLEKLLRDPSLRHNEQGRRLLRLLQQNAIEAPTRPGLVAAVPPHCTDLVARLARQHSEMWLDFARDLDERARVIYPWDNGQE